MNPYLHRDSFVEVLQVESQQLPKEIDPALYIAKKSEKEKKEDGILRSEYLKAESIKSEQRHVKTRRAKRTCKFEVIERVRKVRNASK